jgi:hypothetical protein
MIPHSDRKGIIHSKYAGIIMIYYYKIDAKKHQIGETNNISPFI